LTITENPETLPIKNQINLVCKNISKFLLSKDAKYGGSISDPEHIFTCEDDDELKLLYTRIDDKLKRIKGCKGKDLRKNDIVDLIGYLIWVCIKKGWFSFRDLID